ncbi:hypothetical protein ALMP_84940 [Streptomyces sp. A012304]|nr:hypothetical protein ALMP_84940 [Streptomyces sp. A012304]
MGDGRLHACGGTGQWQVGDAFGRARTSARMRLVTETAAGRVTVGVGPGRSGAVALQAEHPQLRDQPFRVGDHALDAA